MSDDNPILRGPVQDPEVPPRLPWPLPRHHRRDRLLPNVLPLVQHRTSPWRDRHAHPGRRPSQSNPERAGAARADPSSRLDPSSRTLRSRDPTTGSPSPSRLDQPTCDTHNRRNCSVNRNRHCLKVVDRFRGREKRPAGQEGTSLLRFRFREQASDAGKAAPDETAVRAERQEHGLSVLRDRKRMGRKFRSVSPPSTQWRLSGVGEPSLGRGCPSALDALSGYPERLTTGHEHRRTVLTQPFRVSPRHIATYSRFPGHLSATLDAIHNQPSRNRCRFAENSAGKLA